MISGQFLGVTIVVLGLTTIASVMVMNAHFRGLRGHRPPAWVRKLFLDWLARFVCLEKVTKMFSLFHIVPGFHEMSVYDDVVHVCIWQEISITGF